MCTAAGWTNRFPLLALRAFFGRPFPKRTLFPQNGYQGDGTDAASQRGLFANWQGSITAVTDATGSAIGVNGYDAYGIPNETNIGRFQYTGQIWLAELGLYYYKARIYSPTLGRFLQTDPIGYEGGYNIYRYAINDPVNYNDPTGLAPGDLFDDVESAAEDWAEYVQSDNAKDAKGKDIKLNSFEYASAFIENTAEDGSKQYSYTEPATDKKNNTYKIALNGQQADKVVGTAHNHNDTELGVEKEGRPSTNKTNTLGRPSDERVAVALGNRSKVTDTKNISTFILGPIQPISKKSGRKLRHFKGRNFKEVK